MQILINVPDEFITNAAMTALRSTFGSERYESGAGAVAIKAQVNQWAKQQDFSHIIAAMAPAIVREAIAGELATAIQKEIKRQVKIAQQAGELAPLLQPTTEWPHGKGNNALSEKSATKMCHTSMQAQHLGCKRRNSPNPFCPHEMGDCPSKQ